MLNITCRYMAIVHPLRHRRSKTRTQTVLVLIWLISVFLAMPCILYSDIKTKRFAIDLPYTRTLNTYLHPTILIRSTATQNF